MPSWLLPIVKLLLPHVGDIVAAAKPTFTKRKSGDAVVEQGALVPQQIAELQAAVSENATHIKELAEQLRLTVIAIEQGAAAAEKRVRRIYALALTAALLSFAALCIALYALMR